MATPGEGFVAFWSRLVRTRVLIGVPILVVIVVVQSVRTYIDDRSRSERRQAERAAVAAQPGLRFSESVVRLPRGGYAVFRNDDAVAHTFTADGGLFDSGPVEPGQSFNFSFAAAGEVSYHCEIHPSMKGRVVVEGEG